jgi:hypothetical protein
MAATSARDRKLTAADSLLIGDGPKAPSSSGRRLPCGVVVDDGRYYEAWLKNAAGILVPVGTFNRTRANVCPSSVSPIDFTTVAVTEQVSRSRASSER